ncbi:MAG: hypothetical protein RL660_2410 [Bacteroidota bacterium]
MGTKVPIFNMTNFEQISAFVNELIEGTDCFIVEAKVAPTNNYKFAIDADTGFGIDRSVKLSRQLRKKIEEAGLHPEGDFSMEVGSPGVDAPLKMPRQFAKNIGRLVLVTFADKEQKPVEGRLANMADDNIDIEITDKKKKTSTTQTIALATTKSVVVQIEF